MLLEWTGRRAREKNEWLSQTAGRTSSGIPLHTVAKLQIRETADVEALSLEKLLHLDHPL